jgi:hypothetical protein
VTVLVLALLAGTAAAFAVTESLKLERSPITAPRLDKRFSPVCACATDTAELGFRLRRGDRLDAAVVDADGDLVRTLVEDEQHRRGNVVFRWDGRGDAGAVLPDGAYRLRVHLDRARRTIVIPNVVLLDTKPPEVLAFSVRRRAFSPNGDGTNDRVPVVYRATEKGSPILLVDGEPAVTGKSRLPRRQRITWGGRLAGETLAPGTYAVALQVRDRAGNLSEPTEAVPVRVRALRIARAPATVPPGGLLRFRVATDAPPFTWTFEPEVGEPLLTGRAPGNAVAVRLPRNLALGRYVLTVVGVAESDRATIVVRRR